MAPSGVADEVFLNPPNEAGGCLRRTRMAGS